MAFKEISSQRFAGFFRYVPGSIIQGNVKEEVINGENERGQESGYIGIELTEPCPARLDDTDFDAVPGQIIAISITNATRVLIGTSGKLVRCTFTGFGKTKKVGHKGFHIWKIEVDE